jgi:hypothetical protein
MEGCLFSLLFRVRIRWLGQRGSLLRLGHVSASFIHRLNTAIKGYINFIQKYLFQLYDIPLPKKLKERITQANNGQGDQGIYLRIKSNIYWIKLKNDQLLHTKTF